MKVTSALLETMSGKLGGAVASKARGGIKYFRALVTPSNPKSTNQSFIRAALTGLAAAWKATLSTEQRAGWTALAHDQESGIDVYSANNTQVLRAGLTRIDDAPPSRSVAFTNAPSNQAGTYGDDGSGNIQLTIVHGKNFLPTGGKLNVYVSNGNQTPSRLAQQFPFTYAGTLTSDGTTTTPTLNIPAFIAANYRSATADGQYDAYCRFVGVTATGEVTSEIIEKLTVDFS